VGNQKTQEALAGGKLMVQVEDVQQKQVLRESAQATPNSHRDVNLDAREDNIEKSLRRELLGAKQQLQNCEKQLQQVTHALKEQQQTAESLSQSLRLQAHAQAQHRPVLLALIKRHAYVQTESSPLPPSPSPGAMMDALDGAAGAVSDAVGGIITGVNTLAPRTLNMLSSDSKKSPTSQQQSALIDGNAHGGGLQQLFAQGLEADCVIISDRAVVSRIASSSNALSAAEHQHGGRPSSNVTSIFASRPSSNVTSISADSQHQHDTFDDLSTNPSLACTPVSLSQVASLVCDLSRFCVARARSRWHADMHTYTQVSAHARARAHTHTHSILRTHITISPALMASPH
jgi:hypothetical protein